MTMGVATMLKGRRLIPGEGGDRIVSLDRCGTREGWGHCSGRGRGLNPRVGLVKRGRGM